MRDVWGVDQNIENKDDVFIVGAWTDEQKNELELAIEGRRVIRAVYETKADGYVFIINKAFQNKLSKVLLYAGNKSVGEDVDISSLCGDEYRIHYNMEKNVDYTFYFIFKEKLFDGAAENLLLDSTALMFWSCGNLIYADFSNFNTQSVTNMSYMFSNCYALAELNLSNFDTINVTTMYNMLEGCSALTKLDLSSFKTKNVTDMSSMFSGCWALTELDLSKFDTQNVTNMGSMFYNCSSLTKLDLSKFNTTKVTNMSYMFAWCEVLTELNLSNFDFSKVGDMNDMFLKCKIKNLFLPQKYKDIRKRCICCGYVYINDEAVVGLNPNNVVFVDGVAG